MLSAELKKYIINEYNTTTNDTGSVEVQVSLLTSRISGLKDHFNIHKQDFHSRRGLLNLVSRRRKLLNYLKYKNFTRYFSLIKRLKLRK